MTKAARQPVQVEAQILGESLMERDDRIRRLGRELRQKGIERIARALALTDPSHQEPAEATALDRVMARRFAEALLTSTGPNAGLLKAAFDYLAATDTKEIKRWHYMKTSVTSGNWKTSSRACSARPAPCNVGSPSRTTCSSSSRPRWM